MIGLLLQFVGGFIFLVGGAELLVRGASRLAARLHVPEIIVGMTVVAFGTSLPELVVSLTANLGGGDGGQIAIGNVVGSNIANLGLILGLAGLFMTLDVKGSYVKRELPVLLGVTALFIVLAVTGTRIDRIEGALLVLGLIAFTLIDYRIARKEAAFADAAQANVEAAEAIDEEIAQPSTQFWFDGLLVIMGLGGLVLGAQLLVGASQSIARSLGVPELIIGLTLVAVGTSLPEVATSLVAVFRGNGDIAVGNVVGSNLFNLMGIAGITALVKPLPLPPGIAMDFGVMAGLTALVYFMVWRKPHDIKRWEAAILLGSYILYVGFLVLRRV